MYFVYRILAIITPLWSCMANSFNPLGSDMTTLTMQEGRTNLSQ